MVNLFKTLKSILGPEKEKEYNIRSPRVSGAALESFTLYIKDKTFPYGLDNISLTGFAFFNNEDNDSFQQLDETLEGEIQYQTKSFKVEFNIVRQQKNIFGAHFSKVDPELQSEIRKLLKNKLAAIEIGPIEDSFLPDSKHGKPHWLYGGKDCEVFYVINNEDNLYKFNINLFGDYIQMDDKGQILYSQIVHEEKDDHIEYKQSTLIDPSENIPRDVFENCEIFISNLVHLPDDIKKQFLNNLKVASSGQI